MEGRQKEAEVNVKKRQIQGMVGTLPVRLYSPSDPQTSRNLSLNWYSSSFPVRAASAERESLHLRMLEHIKS